MSSSEMASHKLYDLAIFQNGRAFRPSETSASDGLPIVKIAEMTKGITSNTGIYDGSVDAKHLIQAGDLLFAWSGTIAVQQYSGPKAVLNQHIFKVTAKPDVDQDYLKYVLLSLMPVFDLLVLDQRTTMGHVKVSDLKKIDVNLPPLSVQRTIGALLGALDKKIAINTQINHHLEQMAQAMLVEQVGSMLHPVSNTATNVLGEELQLINGFAFKSSTYLESGRYSIITIKNVQDGVITPDGSNRIEELPKGMNPACILQFGDVLLSLTGNVGRVGMVTDDNLLLNQRVAKLDPMHKELLPFWYFVFRSEEMKDHLIKIAKGTAQQNLSPVETLRTSISFDASKAAAFAEDVSPLFWVIAENRKESSLLSSLRDSLLPRLMSGELSVEDLDGK